MIRKMPEDIYFEGFGDVVCHENRAIIGHDIPSDIPSGEFLKEIVPDLKILTQMKIVDDHYFHLAMALGFINADTVIYYPPAFDSESVAGLKKRSLIRFQLVVQMLMSILPVIIW